MLSSATRCILRILRIRTAASFPFRPQLTLRLEPMFHVTAVHSPFPFKNLVGALRDLIVVELSRRIGITKPFRGTAISGRAVSSVRRRWLVLTCACFNSAAGLRGAMVWDLGSDDNAHDLSTALGQFLTP